MGVRLDEDDLHQVDDQEPPLPRAILEHHGDSQQVGVVEVENITYKLHVVFLMLLRQQVLYLAFDGLGDLIYILELDYSLKIINNVALGVITYCKFIYSTNKPTEILGMFIRQLNKTISIES